MHALVTVGAMLLLLLAPPARGEERFALLIGANVGWANDKPLRYAESDAERIRDVLVELGGFSAERVVLLRDPDTAEVRAQLERMPELLRRLGEDSLFIFYYSGHADERHLHLRGKPLSVKEVRTALESLPATVRLGILDACRSGSILTAKGGGPEAGAFSMQVVDELRARGLALLASSGADELSQETRALAGSVFTHHLVSGMRGAADSDGDGAVVLSESWKHAFQRTTADTAPTPVPHRPAYLYELAGQGEPVLTRLSRAQGRLVLPAAEGERYVVVDAHESRLVAEAHAIAEGPQVLALPVGSYRVKRVRASRLDVAELTLGAGARVEAARLAYTQKALEGGLLKGRPSEEDTGALREWRRGEALRLLASGEAGAALALFDELLASDPTDAASLRGKARALVRLAESYDRVGDRQRQAEALREALKAEPGLVNDPDLSSRRGELLALAAPPPEPPPAPTKPARPQDKNVAMLFDVLDWVGRVLTRLQEEHKKSVDVGRDWKWGLGLEPIGPRGLFALVGTRIFGEVLHVSASVDIAGPGVGAGVRLIPRVSSWNWYFGAGGHLGVGTLAPSLRPGYSVWMADTSLSYQRIWGHSLHGEVGLHYLSPRGVSLEFGLGLVFMPPSGDETEWRGLPIVSLGAGWFFRSHVSRSGGKP